MKNLDLKKKEYLKWSFRPTFKREKQFRNEPIEIEKEMCRTKLNLYRTIHNLIK